MTLAQLRDRRRRGKARLHQLETRTARVQARLVQLNRKIERKERLRHLHPLAMYDDVNLDLIPHDAVAVAGYTGGNYPTYRELVRRFPEAHHLSIAVASTDRTAVCLDVEPGDASPAAVPTWVRAAHARGIARPVIYASVSAMQGILNLLAGANIPRSAVRVWTAHYTGRPHRCSPASCGYGLRTVADATQWTDRALGRSLDESLLVGGFFG